jgi:hypothetical protein
MGSSESLLSSNLKNFKKSYKNTNFISWSRQIFNFFTPYYMSTPMPNPFNFKYGIFFFIFIAN